MIVCVPGPTLNPSSLKALFSALRPPSLPVSPVDKSACRYSHTSSDPCAMHAHCHLHCRTVARAEAREHGDASRSVLDATGRREGWRAGRLTRTNKRDQVEVFASLLRICKTSQLKTPYREGREG